MKTWQLWTAATIIFLAGAVLGVVGTGTFIRHAVQSGLKDGSGPFMRLLEHRLESRLRLSTEQKLETLRILNQSRQDLLAVRQRYQPEVQSIISNTVEVLKQDLNEQQQKELDDMFLNFQKNFPQFQPKH